MAMMMMERPDADVLLSGLMKMGISEKSADRTVTNFKQEAAGQQNYARMSEATFAQGSNSQVKQNNGDATFDIMTDFRSNGVETECEELNKAVASQAAANAQARAENIAMSSAPYDGKQMQMSTSKASLEAYRRYLQPGLPRQLSYPDEVYMSSGQLKLKEDFYNMQSQSMNALDQQHDGSPDMFFRSANIGCSRPTPMNQWRLNQQYQQQQQLNTAITAPFMPRKYRLNVQKALCGFCKKNGEAVTWYTSHNLKEPNGKILCPVLRAFQCPECQATGDFAHTIRYCPKNEKPDAFQSVLNMKYLRNPISKRRPTGMNMSPPSHSLSPTSPSFYPSQYMDMEKNINWSAGGAGQWMPFDSNGTKIYNDLSQNQPINIPRRSNLFQF